MELTTSCPSGATSRCSQLLTTDGARSDLWSTQTVRTLSITAQPSREARLSWSGQKAAIRCSGVHQIAAQRELSLTGRLRNS